MVVGEPLELVVGAVLHRMRDEHQRRIDAERLCSGRRGFGGGDAYRWSAARFEIRMSCVQHETNVTARRAMKRSCRDRATTREIGRSPEHS